MSILYYNLLFETTEWAVVENTLLEETAMDKLLCPSSSGKKFIITITRDGKPCGNLRVEVGDLVSAESGVWCYILSGQMVMKPGMILEIGEATETK